MPYSSHPLQDRLEWSSRLAQTSSLPPPWQIPSGSPSLVRQQAATLQTEPAPSQASRTQPEQLLGSPQPSLQQQRTLQSLSSLCTASGSPCLTTEASRSVNAHLHSDLVSESAQKLQSGLSESDVHGSMSAISKQPRKYEQRVQIVSNHLSPPGKPHQMSSQLIQPGNVLAAQPQHCSPGVGKDRDVQHAHSAAHTTGTRTALMQESSCRPHQTFARVGCAATEIFRMDWDLDRSNDFDACLIVSINDLPSTPG